MLSLYKLLCNSFSLFPKGNHLFSSTTTIFDSSQNLDVSHCSDLSATNEEDSVNENGYWRVLEFPSLYYEPIQCWVETLKQIEDKKLGIINLHPCVWHVHPRTDIIFKNVLWQSLYRKIDYSWTPRIHEIKGGGRKPWPQKETGRARQGSNRAPQWVKGYVVHGPRGPKSYFYMPPKMLRVLGLCTTLTVKFYQNDVHVVEDFIVPLNDPEYFKDIVEERFWGSSVLFVDDADIMPRNIAAALRTIPTFNLMPAYGLNVYSMLKHETLVLTVRAVQKLENKLLGVMNALDRYDKKTDPLWMP